MFQIYQQPQQPVVTGLPPHGCIIQGVRLSFLNAYIPAKDLNGVPKYSVTLLIPKTYNLTDINNAIGAAIANGIKGPWKGYQPPNLQMPLRDGDMYAAQKPDKRQPYVGNWFINAKQDPEKGKPLMLTEQRTVSTNPQDIQSGDYADVVVEFVPYDNKSQGVSCIPKAIRKTRTGERFTNGVTEAEAAAALGGVVQGGGGFTDVSKLF